MYEDCECFVTKSNSSFKAVCKVQSLTHVDKLLAIIANSVLCLCLVFADFNAASMLTVVE